MPILASRNRHRVFSCARHGCAARVSGFLLAGCLFGLLFVFQANEGCAQPASQEYPLKAVFMLNFARFTEWPSNAFPSSDAPFTVGILGHSPFGSLMEETVSGEAINRHKIVVEYYEKLGDIKNCDMLFICQDEARRVHQIEDVLKTMPILTVADFPNASGDGVCVQFVTQNNKIHFRINISALKQAHLTMSSELLRLADIVSR